MSKVVVIGGGASGLFASYASAMRGNETILIEKNDKLGKKIYITGKGRCNLTASVSNQEFFNNVVSNPKFLFSAINSFSSYDTIDFFTNNGLELKTERGNRVFPASDKASDVTKTLEKCLLNLGVDIRLNTQVLDVITEGGAVKGVTTGNGEVLCDSIIVCTGGISYPTTGSTGDGYKFAKKFGHSIVDLRPALVGIELCGSDFLEMQGLSLKNVKISAFTDGKQVFDDFGEMLFTHFGISGPIVLSCSSKINRLSNVEISIDLKPALDFVTLENRLIREFKENSNKTLFYALRSLLPKTLIECVIRQARLSPQTNCSQVTVEMRRQLINVLKGLKFTVKKLRVINEAIVTSGGVSVKEINPKTMESKLVKNLYFAGEVLDVDAFTGGYNLQIAFSTGFVAGNNC
ncbi:MAG: NAD(P)/FAD-dependent oxidoreductase [Clostridia bacterium]|nr:NAD(P)/FAD-dependent oxidoreductase [Clostridia bacterium]